MWKIVFRAFFPGSLELVHLPFNLRSLSMPTMEMKAMASHSSWHLGTLSACVLSHSYARHWDSSHEVHLDPSWAGGFSSSCFSSPASESQFSSVAHNLVG